MSQPFDMLYENELPPEAEGFYPFAGVAHWLQDGFTHIVDTGSEVVHAVGDFAREHAAYMVIASAVALAAPGSAHARPVDPDLDTKPCETYMQVLYGTTVGVSHNCGIEREDEERLTLFTPIGPCYSETTVVNGVTIYTTQINTVEGC